METASLLGLYLKLNLVLAGSYLVWRLTRWLAQLLRFEVGHLRQLALARAVFVGVTVVLPLFLFSNLPAWLGDDAKPLLAADLAVMANLDTALAQPYAVSDVTLVPALILATLLVGGLLVQLVRLARQVTHLRAIVGDAVEYKCLRGVHLLFSTAVSTPFSTQALGKRQIVLPYQLLDSPRNLRLAVKHELQHMRHRDLEWVIVYEIASVFFFWNPAMWLWHNEFDCLQEFACDEALVNDRRVSSTAYGNCLLEVARASTGGALIASSNMVPKFSFWTNRHSQLKRRILMLSGSRNTKHTELKSLAYALVTTFGLLQTALVAFAADVDQDVVPLVRINPDYPQQALTEGMEGWVQLEFTITETGAVADPLVVDNSVCLRGQEPEDCKPDDMFNSTALAAIAKWRYTPKLEDGVPVEYKGVQTIIRFTLGEPPEGCLYASKLYLVGETHKTETSSGTIEQTCMKDPENPGDFRWGDSKLNGRAF